MEALAVGGSRDTPPSTNDQWVQVFAADMTDESANDLYVRVHVRSDRLSGLRLSVIWNQLCLDAFGLTDLGASKLAATYLSGWFVFRSWALRKGLRVDDLAPEDVLTAIYGQLVDGCQKEDELAALNRQIFRSSNPWG